MGHPDLPIILLAAGSSSRMRGRDKLMEPVDGQPLLGRQARMARDVTDGLVIVALPAPPHPRYAALKGLDVTALPVTDAAEGMNASLRSAFADLPDRARLAMLLLADLPELTAEDLRKVIDAATTDPKNLIWRGTTEDGAPGHPILFDASLFPAFATLTGDSGGREVVLMAGDRVCLVTLPGQRARRDLDTPEDWAAWRDEQAK